MSLNSFDPIQENTIISEQQRILNKLKEEVESLPSSCSIEEREGGKLRVHLESYVIELQNGNLDEESRVIPIDKIIEVDADLIQFEYSKYEQNGWNLQERKIPKGSKEFRETITLFRVDAKPETTLVRLGHLYPNPDSTVGSTGGIFGLLPDYHNHDNPSRYFPDDSTEGVNINHKISTIQFDTVKSTGDIIDDKKLSI